MMFSFLDAIRCIKHFSLPRIPNVKFPRREITRKCRDRTDTLHEIGSPRRAYHGSSLARAARRAIYFSLGIRSSPVIALPTITVLKVTRIVFCRSFEYTFPSLYSFGLTRSLLVFFLFSIFFHLRCLLARPSHPFAFLRVVRAYEFDFTRFPSIGEHRKLFLEQPILLCPPSNLYLQPCPPFPYSSYIPG